MRKFTLDRWNFSKRSGKWVWVTKSKSGKRKYFYQLEPPKEFIELTMKIKQLNDKMLKTEDLEENERIFRQMMEYSKLLQNMGRE